MTFQDFIILICEYESDTFADKNITLGEAQKVAERCLDFFADNRLDGVILSNFLDVIRDDNKEEKICEYDCDYVCTGCGVSYCDIKTDNNLSHEEELPEAFTTDAGNHYCHSDCCHAG